MSRGLLEYLHDRVQAANALNPPRFHIDAAYEFARLVQNMDGPALLDSPAFCSAPSGGSQGQGCALTACATVTGGDKANLRVEDIVFAVKTWSGNYETRVPVVQETWAPDARNIVYYGDTANEAIPTRSTGVPNVTQGHCVKTYANFRDLEARYDDQPWFFIADDDTVLNVGRVTAALSHLDVPADQPALVGERYGYGHTGPTNGYDYITMGGGMAMNRAALHQLLAADCSCPELTTPGDGRVQRDT